MRIICLSFNQASANVSFDKYNLILNKRKQQKVESKSLSIFKAKIQKKVTKLCHKKSSSSECKKAFPVRSNSFLKNIRNAISMKTKSKI